jgi:hypothetical protein
MDSAVEENAGFKDVRGAREHRGTVNPPQQSSGNAEGDVVTFDRSTVARPGWPVPFGRQFR